MVVRQTISALVLLLASVVASPLPGAAQTAIVTQSEPVGIMSAIYREAIKSGASGWLDPDQRPKYMSAALLALWAKVDAKKPADGDEGPIDFDITADTNGLALESFVARVPRQTADVATVAVELGYQKPYVRPEGVAIVTYDFVRENGRWVIDNIRTPRWSIRNLLSRWLKDG